MGEPAVEDLLDDCADLAPVVIGRVGCMDDRVGEVADRIGIEPTPGRVVELDGEPSTSSELVEAWFSHVANGSFRGRGLS